METLTNKQLLEIGIAVGGSLLLGFLIKKFIFPFLYRLTHKTKWKSDDLIIESAGKWIIFWFFLAACLYALPIFTDTFSYARNNEATLKNIIGSLYILSITMMTASIAAGMLQIRSQKDDSEIPTTSILGNIAKAIVYCIGLILILHRFGVAIAPLVTALGVGGIAVALALQPTLSNLFSGLQLIASGKINIGDFVQLENGQKGFVRDITWRNTTIETAQNNVIIVPNSKMADSIIENFFLTDREITFNVLVGVGYESDLEKVEKVSIQVAKEILDKFDGGVKEFEPFVRFYNFGDSSIDLKIFMRVKEYADQFMMTSEFIKALHSRYNQEGINIPFPIRTVYMNQ
ncbi:MAG TPA: mechanosensitive ion channel family protein [Chitinophagaceae bacterium]|nr:mechanosensitive ion channel family protein [Chitinophagales bacterium]HPG10253.1 mechanosensitive ion channel family protein [Chitinophagaceae bacterium]